jgi:hypothetical protein
MKSAVDNDIQIVEGWKNEPTRLGFRYSEVTCQTFGEIEESCLLV